MTSKLSVVNNTLALKEHVRCFNHARPHLGIGQRIPARFGERAPAQSGRIIATPVLGGLHHGYSRVASPN